MVINITVRDKIAVAKYGSKIVCKNEGYVAHFDFDAEWDGYSKKTARFGYDDDKAIKIDFEGDDCAIPKLPNTTLLLVEVSSGGIKTAVPAVIECLPVLPDEYEDEEPPSEEPPSEEPGEGCLPEVGEEDNGKILVFEVVDGAWSEVTLQKAEEVYV